MSEVKYTFTKGHYNCNQKVAKLKNICWTKHTNSILYYIHPQAVNGLSSIYAEYYKKDSLGSYKFNEKSPQLKPGFNTLATLDKWTIPIPYKRSTTKDSLRLNKFYDKTPQLKTRFYHITLKKRTITFIDLSCFALYCLSKIQEIISGKHQNNSGEAPTTFWCWSQWLSHSSFLLFSIQILLQQNQCSRPGLASYPCESSRECDRRQKDPHGCYCRMAFSWSTSAFKHSNGHFWAHAVFHRHTQIRVAHGF